MTQKEIKLEIKEELTDDEYNPQNHHIAEPEDVKPFTEAHVKSEPSNSFKQDPYEDKYPSLIDQERMIMNEILEEKPLIEQQNDVIEDYQSLRVVKFHRRKPITSPLNFNDYPYDVKPEHINNKNAPGGINQRCSLCFKLQCESFMERDFINEDKLLIATACILRNEMSLDQAKMFYVDTSPQIICCHHFQHLISTFYNALGIRRIEKLNNCSLSASEFVTSLMISIMPDFDARLFFVLFSDFVRRHPNTQEYDTHRPSWTSRSYRICTFCQRTRLTNEIATTRSRDLKTLVLIGYIISGKVSIEAAKLLSMKVTYHICHTHFRETINEILRSLSVVDSFSMYSLTTKEMDDFLMQINDVFPSLNFLEFTKLFERFKTRIIRMKI